MSEHLRRSVPRQPVDWFAFYRFDGAPEGTWRGCRVIDLSPAGAGVELFEVGPAEPLRGPITVSIELHGAQRNVVMDESHHTARIGIQFPILSPAANEYIRSLDGARW